MENQTKASLQIVEVEGVRGYVDSQGTAWLNAEDIARGLGFVMVRKERVTTSGDNSPESGDNVSTSGDNEKTNYYTAGRWDRVNSYLNEFDLSPQVGKIPQKVGKGDYIPEQVFYLLAMKANNDAAKAFQMKIAFEILPSIRKYGYYSLAADPAPVVKTNADKADFARVYLLKLSDGTVQIVKIGQSNNIRSRVAKIKRDTGLTVIDMYFTSLMPRNIARLVEWACQEVFSSWRIKGEFFSVEFSEVCAKVNYFLELATAAPITFDFEHDEKSFKIDDKDKV